MRQLLFMRQFVKEMQTEEHFFAQKAGASFRIIVIYAMILKETDEERFI